MSVTTTVEARAAGIMPTVLGLVAGLAILGVVFLPECRAAVGVWIDSTAYGHCFLVLPIAAYLAWERKDSLRGLRPRLAPAFLLLGLPLPLIWFAAERLGIMEGRQLVVIAFVELLCLVLLGWRLYSALLGPLLYLVFLVPFGEFTTPYLQAFTAHFIDIGLTIIAVPHFANDMVVEVSGGTFYVAEACAGLRFLIASIAFGVFYALLNYHSPGRRVAFMAASIVVPIIANGFRAMGIVYLGYLLGSAQAAAADHIIYGWLFFSVVTLCLVAGGLPFREQPVPARLAPPSSPGIAHPWPVPVLVILVAVLAVLAPAASLALDRSAGTAKLAGTATFAAPAGCQLGTPEIAPDRNSTTVVCGPRRWTVTMQTVPARSTGGGLNEARRRLLGPLDPEGVAISTLHDLPPSAGNWQVTTSEDPGQIAGMAVWIHGQPAVGGLRQRLLQARDSVFGNTVPPLIALVQTHVDHRMPEAESDDLTSELARIVSAQPDLDAQVRRLTTPP